MHCSWPSRCDACSWCLYWRTIYIGYRIKKADSRCAKLFRHPWSLNISDKQLKNMEILWWIFLLMIWLIMIWCVTYWLCSFAVHIESSVEIYFFRPRKFILEIRTHSHRWKSVENGTVTSLIFSHPKIRLDLDNLGWSRSNVPSVQSRSLSCTPSPICLGAFEIRKQVVWWFEVGMV